MANQGKARVLNPEEHEQFLQFLATSRQASLNKAVYLLGLRSGARIGSIAGLHLNDVLDTSGNLKEVVELRRDIVKNRKNYAIYLVHPELRTALLEYLAVRSETEVPNLFVSQKNTAFSANALSHKMLKLFREAGLDGASSHSNRRGFATACIRAGVDIVSLKTLMNHASINQTSEYVFTNDDVLKRAVLAAG
jgi:integrase/recombinase XerD